MRVRLNTVILYMLITLLLTPIGKGYGQTEYKQIVRDTSYQDSVKRLLKKGDHLQKTELFDSAVTIYSQALLLSRQNRFRHGAMEALIGLGVAYRDMGYYGKSMQFFKEALVFNDTSKEIQDLLPALYNGIAGTYHYWEDYDKAVQYQLKAITTRQKYGSGLSLALLYNNISGSLLQAGRREEALFYLHKGEILAGSMERKELLVQILLRLSTIYHYKKDYAKSKQYLKNALKISKEYNDKSVQQSVYMNLAIQTLNNKDAVNSIRYSKAALKLDEGKNVKGQLIIMKQIGTAYIELEDYSAAEYWLNRSLALAQSLNNLQYIGELHRILTYLHYKKCNIDSVYLHHGEALFFADSTKFKEQAEASTRMEVQYRTEQKDKEIAERQLLINRQKNVIQVRNIWTGVSITGLIISIFLLTILKHRN